MAKETTLPWKDGIYKFSGMSSKVFVVTGENANMRKIGSDKPGSRNAKWVLGEYGDCHSEVEKLTGQKVNNVEVKLEVANWFWDGKLQGKGVVSENGKRVTVLNSTSNKVEFYEWMSESEYLAFKDSGEPADAPPNHYKLQPDYTGKLLWIDGRPGLGKSTVAQLLSKMFGYVYYEGDAFFSLVNPYLPPNIDEPTNAVQQQKRLTGIPQNRIDAIEMGSKAHKAMRYGNPFDVKDIEEMYNELCKDITKERKRIGGDWVIAQGVPNRAMRDYIRTALGPDLVFVVLNMEKEEQKKRIESRHGNGGDTSDWIYNCFEPVIKDEENTIEVMVSNTMSRDDVVKVILEKLPN